MLQADASSNYSARPITGPVGPADRPLLDAVTSPLSWNLPVSLKAALGYRGR
jgi:hypothetical protein